MGVAPRHVVYAPTVAAWNCADRRVSQETASTDYSMCCFIGLIVEYILSRFRRTRAARTSPRSRTPPPQTLPSRRHPNRRNRHVDRSPTAFLYQFKSAGSNVGTNSTTNTYVAQSSDIGNTITVVVTASNAGGPARRDVARDYRDRRQPAAPVNTVLAGNHGQHSSGQHADRLDGNLDEHANVVHLPMAAERRQHPPARPHPPTRPWSRTSPQACPWP